MSPRITLAAALSLAVSATPAVAQVIDDSAATATVSIADLDLARPADQTRLNIRINSSINRLCRTVSHSLNDILSAQRCSEAARASAAPQINRAIAQSQRNQRLAAIAVRGAN